MIDTCASCASPATVRLYGKYRNGRETTDYRCDDHRPKASGRSLVDEEARGLWAFHGTSARMFRIESIERITP